jgi:hypothetical protein
VSVSSKEGWKGASVVQHQDSGSPGLVEYPIDWSVQYPDKRTRNGFREFLREQAAHWPGWENFPWYMTRTLHRHRDGPPADFDHLHAAFWMRGYAADVILNHKFEDRRALFDVLMRHEVQFAGIFRQIVIEEIRWCLNFAKQERLPDCELRGVDTPENVAALEEKRRQFREGIEHAKSEFVRVLNFASQMDDPKERIAGRPLRAWFAGGDLPDPVTVRVRVSEENGAVYLRPCARASARFVSRHVPVPRIDVCPASLLEPVRPGSDGPGIPDSDEDENSRKIALKAFDIATRLDDGSNRKKRPSHLEVLREYCVEGLTVDGIRRKCRCSKGTVINRKKDLEKMLGRSLESFMQYAGTLQKAEKALRDGRATRIYRKALAE